MASSTGPSTRTLARVFFTLAAFAVFLYVLYLIRDVVTLVLIAIFLAVALGPAVDFFARRRVPRGLSILLTYVLIFLVTFGIGALIVPPIVTEVNNFAQEIPTYIQEAQKNETIREYDRRYKIADKLEDSAKELPRRFGDAASALQAVTVGVFWTLLQLVTVLTLTFFMLLDGGGLFSWLASLFGREREERIRDVSRHIYRAVAGYVAGALTIALIAGTVTYITLTILGVPFAVPLAVLMAFLDLIPLIGASIGGFLIGVVTLFENFPTATIVWAIVVLVYQQVENSVVQPVVYRRTVNVAPLFVIVSILIGSTLLGVLGALVAIPVAAAVQIIVRDLWRRRERNDDLLVVEGEEPLEGAPPAGASRVIRP